MNIDRILNLARLEIENEEKRGLEKDFSSILEFVKKIENLKVEKVKPMSHPVEIFNQMREDQEYKEEDKNEKLKIAKKLINAAPEKKDNCVKVKQIL